MCCGLKRDSVGWIGTAVAVECGACAVREIPNGFIGELVVDSLRSLMRAPRAL